MDDIDQKDDDINLTNYPMSIDTIIGVEDGQKVTAGQVCKNSKIF